MKLRFAVSTIFTIIAGKKIFLSIQLSWLELGLIELSQAWSAFKLYF
jgi:hypothetical protein